MRRRPNTKVLLSLVIVLAACAPADESQEDAMEETVSAVAGMEAMQGQPQVYPNIPAPMLFENDEIIAQSWTSEPGVWAGEHSHMGNQLAVVVKGGTILYREGGVETPVTYQEGDVYWIKATTHDHSGGGDSPVEMILITVR